MISEVKGLESNPLFLSIFDLFLSDLGNNRDIMERKTMIQLFVVFVAVSFMIGMFTYFEREEINKQTGGGSGTQDNTTETFVAAEGKGMGRLMSYESTIYVSPWNESYRGIIESLKSEKQVEYLNFAGETAVLTTSSKSNLSYIREKLENIDSDVFTEVVIAFSDPIKFTLINGSIKNMSISPINVMIDPATPKDEMIPASITADISQINIKNEKVKLEPKKSTVILEKELGCGQSYWMQGSIGWENRSVDLNSYAILLNISRDEINYMENDIVILPRKINSTEMEILRNKNLSFLTAIFEDSINVNTTSKAEVESAISSLGISGLSYSDSIMNATFSAAESDLPALTNELGKTLDNLKLKRSCGTSISTVTINGTKYFVEIGARDVANYLNIIKAVDGNANVTLEVYTIGRSLTKITLLDVQ